MNPFIPAAMLRPKKELFPPILLKIQHSLGGGGVASFTNISGQVLTLLTSLAVATYDNGIWTF